MIKMMRKDMYKGAAKKARMRIVLRYGLIAVICILTVVLYVLGTSPLQQSVGVESVNRHHLVGEYSTDGVNWIELRNAIPSGTESVDIRARFAEELPQGANLYLDINNLSVQVSINGKEMADFGREGTYPSFSEAPGMAIIAFENMHLEDDDLIEMHIENPYPTFRPNAIQTQLDTFFFSGYRDVLLLVMREANWLVAMLGLIIIIVGVFTFFRLIIYLKSGYVESRREISVLAAFTFFSWTCGFYVVSEAAYSVLPIFFRSPVLCNVIDIIPQFFLVCASASYFYSVMTDDRLKKIMERVIIGIYSVILISLIIQALGIRDLYRMQLVPAVCGALALAFGAPILIYEYRKHKNKSALFVLLSFVPIILAEIMGFMDELFGIESIGPFSTRIIFCMAVAFTSWLQLLRLANMSKDQAYQTNVLALAQKELNDTRISMMMSQIQPHFLYNALNTIQYQCQIDGEKAAMTVESFAKFLRGNMDSLSQTEPIPLSQEIAHLENYLAIERLRFPDIQYIYKLKASDFHIPALTIQPLVENSIRYGVRAMEEGGTITIESWEDEHNYYARVSDNGVGFDVNQKKKNDGRSHIGMQNIKSRVQSMCGGHVEIESKIGVGTRSTIVIPKGGKKR